MAGPAHERMNARSCRVWAGPGLDADTTAARKGDGELKQDSIWANRELKEIEHRDRTSALMAGTLALPSGRVPHRSGPHERAQSTGQAWDRKQARLGKQGTRQGLHSARLVKMEQRARRGRRRAQGGLRQGAAGRWRERSKGQLGSWPTGVGGGSRSPNAGEPGAMGAAWVWRNPSREGKDLGARTGAPSMEGLSRMRPEQD